MSEKPQFYMQTSLRIKNSIFNLIYMINLNTDFKMQTNVIAFVINIIINIFIFCTFPQIDLFSKSFTFLSNQFIIVLLILFSIILSQIFLCIIFKKEIYLGIQLKLVRFIVFPLGYRQFLNLMIQQPSNQILYAPLCLLFVLICFGLTVLFCSQSYNEKKLHHSSIPLNSSLMTLQVLFYSIQFCPLPYRLILIFAMLLLSISFRYTHFSDAANSAPEYKALSISSFMFCIYSGVVFVAVMTQVKNIIVLVIIVSPIVVYQVVAEIVKEKRISIEFKNIFNTENMNFDRFIQYVEYLVEESIGFQNIGSNCCQSLTFSFYLEHQRVCQRASCKFVSQKWKNQFTDLSDPRNLKKISQIVVLKLEYLFDQAYKSMPENIELKIAMAKFYVYVIAKKVKVLQLLTQIETMNIDLVKDYQIFRLKNLVINMENKQILDNLKVDLTVNQFQKLAYMAINSMIQFWLLFSEEKIDMSRVIETSENLFCHKKKMQEEWQKNKNIQSFSTLKIMILYVYYLKYILNDFEQSQYLNFYSKHLQQKLLQKKQIRYLSYSSQSGTIVISLSQASLGKIVMANRQTSNIFNFTKDEISKIDLKQLMPKVFADQHDHYLIQFRKNRVKRINSDERFLFGKDKKGMIFPILLQLQRAINSLSQELLFVANINKFKVRQTPILCVTDEEGQIIDISSGFKKIFFEKSLTEQQVNKKKNIQEVIPNFFENQQSQNQSLKFTQLVQSHSCGQLKIQFTVTPISFPLKPNGGFMISAQIKYIVKKHTNLKTMKLTQQIGLRQNLPTQKILYSEQKNRYEFDSFVSKIVREQTRVQHHTIPFLSLQAIVNLRQVPNTKVEYGHSIKTARLSNDALIRVQVNETFQTDDMSETEKVTEYQLKQQKFDDMHNQESIQFICWSKFIILLLTVLAFVFLVLVFRLLKQETASRTSLLDQIKFRYEVRGYLAQYILSFEGNASHINDTYFDNKISVVMSQIVDVIESSSIAQKNKQDILKVVYLKNQAELSKLISSTTLNFPMLQSTSISQISLTWLGYILTIVVYLLFQIGLKCLHLTMKKQIYMIFLGVDDKIIKKNYQECLKFSKMLEEKAGEVQHGKKAVDKFDDSTDNPIRKMKKYKENQKLDLVSWFKYTLPLVLILFVCVLMIFMMKIDADSFNKQYEAHGIIYKLFSQSSVALMNVFLLSYKQLNLNISESFTETYQSVDSVLLAYTQSHQQSLGSSFFTTQLNNACLSSLSWLLPAYQSLCQSFGASMFTTGMGKVTNHIASEIQFQQLHLRSVATQFDEKFFYLYFLEYDFYIPIVKSMSQVISSTIRTSAGQFQSTYNIWVDMIMVALILYSVYVWQFLLGEIKDQITQAKKLLQFISDNFEKERETKQKKKPKINSYAQIN